jgi:hypothetical protein
MLERSDYPNPSSTGTRKAAGKYSRPIRVEFASHAPH